MKNKKRNIVILILILLIVLILWISGIIPKQIAKTYGTYYLKKNFPKIQLEYENIEWASSFGDYIITFKDENDERYGFIIGPKYFPIKFGQGMHGFRENYSEKYNEQTENDNMKSTIKAVVVKVYDKSLVAMETENTNGLISVGFTEEGNIVFEQGQEILIYFDGTIMTSYPAQLSNVEKIEIIKEKSDIQIPEQILRFCFNSYNNVNVNISELTSSGISLTITDTNELPYNYSHSYIIYKKFYNEEYTGIGYQIGEDTKNSTSGYTRNRS